MPRYLHIPHTPDTARTLTLSGRNGDIVKRVTSADPGVVEEETSGNENQNQNENGGGQNQNQGGSGNQGGTTNPPSGGGNEND